MTNDKYIIGVDFGTDSVRAILMNGHSGEEVSASVSDYSRWGRGKYCNVSENKFRQHPLDHIEGLEEVVSNCVKSAGATIAQNIIAISVATTGSTPGPVNQSGTPLALLDSFRENPDAMFVLWKDHTSIPEAREINSAAKKFETDYLKFVGGSYSPEWYWAKLLHGLRTNKTVMDTCYTWVEHSDWIPFMLTGGKDAGQIKRNVCAAGHKGLWSNEFGGLPPSEFFEAVDTRLLPFVTRFGKKVFHAGEKAGNLCEEWAEKFGLSTNVIIGVGALDAHMGAVGGGIKPYFLSKVMGTSTCDMMVVPKPEMKGVYVKGISGQVEDSIVPGMVGLEAGQSAFGDIYSWFRDLLMWPLKNIGSLQKQSEDEWTNLKSGMLKKLDKEASQVEVNESSEFSVDWFNGRRTPNVNPDVKGLIGGLSLGSNAVNIYRALVEATAFGSRAIAESIEKQGIKIDGVTALGGIATKSEFVVQMIADTMNRPVRLPAAEQTVALGAAMFAGVVGGIYQNVEQAIEKLSARQSKTIYPRKAVVSLFDRRYEVYKRYGNLQDQLLNKKELVI